MTNLDANIDVDSMITLLGNIFPDVTATFNSGTDKLTFSAPLRIDVVNAHIMDAIDGVDVCVSEGANRGGEFSCAVLFNQCCFSICAPRMHATHKYTHTHSQNPHAHTFKKQNRLAWKHFQAYVCGQRQSQGQIDPCSCW
jgi:hypothetical protein